MNAYEVFGNWSLFVYLAGCFIAVALSLSYSTGNRLLPQTYGFWIASAFAIHHLIIPNAAHTWHFYWYLWNAMIAAFPVLLAHKAKDADASSKVKWLGVAAVLLCLVYALFSAYDHPLPGILYFYGGHTCEASQVACMIIWSGPVVPALGVLKKFILKRSKGSWMLNLLYLAK